MATFIDLKNKIKTLKSSLYTLAISKGASFDGDVESLTFTKILQGMETIQVGGTGGNYSDSEVLSLEEVIAQMGGTVNKVGDIATATELATAISTLQKVDGIVIKPIQDTCTAKILEFKRIQASDDYTLPKDINTYTDNITTTKDVDKR